MSYDFSGWATKNDLRCADGRTIRKNAFKDNDGTTVPLVWQHDHNDPENVLGHALLENREQGVYAYCTFNDTDRGQHVKSLVQHGDICSLSIYANQLKQNKGDVYHGVIREVSIVLSGANPGALIDFDSIKHSGTDYETEAVIYNDEENLDTMPNTMEHSDYTMDDTYSTESDYTMENDYNNVLEHASDKEKTVQDVFDELTEEQKKVVYFIIGTAIKNKENSDEGDDDMKHNVFDTETMDNTLSHSDMEMIIGDAKRNGSLKDAVLAHGITNIDYLFPDAENMDKSPIFIKRPDAWVSVVMGGVHHTPFSRIKSMFADITEDEARAKGYIKGKLKKEEVFSLLKRTTTPQTIYKKQKLDRDDVIDITDFDVVAWIKTEMRGMLDEELARAILVGDGRLASDDDKINPLNIRPIWTDDTALYTINQVVDKSLSGDNKLDAFITAAVKGRKNYRGSGSPTLFIDEDVLTDLLLMKDGMGRRLYANETDLATALRVSKIVSVPVMDGLTREVSGDTRTLLGIIVNLNDYNIGADKGGAVNMFDDFDIDYNAQKYLIETRCSGALVKPFSAIVIETGTV